MELVRYSLLYSHGNCEQDLAYNAEGVWRYPYFFRLQVLVDASS